MRRVIVLAEAAVDLENARDFYDAVEPGIGDYCVSSLMGDLGRLESLHGIHSQHFGCYRMLASRFPFGIYYLDAASETRVIAILDLRRNPSWIRKELRKRKS